VSAVRSSSGIAAGVAPYGQRSMESTKLERDVGAHGTGGCTDGRECPQEFSERSTEERGHAIAGAAVWPRTETMTGDS
jgi:hypothetical protein